MNVKIEANETREKVDFFTALMSIVFGAIIVLTLGFLIGVSQMDERADDAAAAASSKYNVNVEFETSATNALALWPFKAASGGGLFSVNGQDLRCEYHGLRTDNFVMLCSTDKKSPNMLSVDELQ